MNHTGFFTACCLRLRKMKESMCLGLASELGVPRCQVEGLRTTMSPSDECSSADGQSWAMDRISGKHFEYCRGSASLIRSICCECTKV